MICTTCGSANTACYDCGLFNEICDCGCDCMMCANCSSMFDKYPVAADVPYEHHYEPVIDKNGDLVEEDRIEDVKLPGFENLGTKVACVCTPEKRYYCGDCKVVRGDPSKPWNRAKENDSKSVVTKVSSGKSCGRHYHQPVKLDHAVIHCSSINNERNMKGEEQPIPDYGIYADYSWEPTWRAQLIHWPDYGIPKHYGTAAEQIAMGYNDALEGSDVEIGCIGGHGRTGTILACMVVYDKKGQIDHKDAVKWVRENYCHHAIETEDQVWYVSWFSNYWFGTELAEKPQKKTTSYSGTSSSSGSISPVGSNCQVIEHVAMARRGYKECATKGKECKYWNEDMIRFKNGQTSETTTNASTKLLADYPLKFGGELTADDKSATHLQGIHAAAWEKGHRGEHCPISGENCPYWKEDIEKFKVGDFSTVGKDDALEWLPWFPMVENEEVSSNDDEPVASAHNDGEGSGQLGDSVPGDSVQGN